MRVALAILAGYAAMGLLVFLPFAAWMLVSDYDPESGESPGTAFLVGVEAWGLVSAAVAGYVAAWIGRRGWAAPLGLVVFSWLMDYVSMVAGSGAEPLLFSLAHFVVMLAGIALGAWLRLRANS